MLVIFFSVVLLVSLVVLVYIDVCIFWLLDVLILLLIFVGLISNIFIFDWLWFVLIGVVLGYLGFVVFEFGYW